MSEKKTTIEERYDKAQGILFGLYGYDDVPSREPEFLEHFVKDLMAEREALRWIPVTERLPESSGNYRTTLGINPAGAEGILSLLSFTYFDVTKQEWRDADVIAWMERPAPYIPPKEGP